jgi:hypothetical protein
MPANLTTHTPKPGRSQVHPTARSLTSCEPNINAIRLGLNSKVLLPPIAPAHFGKKYPPPTPTHTPKPGRGQVHPTARSLTCFEKNINAIQLRLNSKVLLLPIAHAILGKSPGDPEPHPKTRTQPGSPHSKKLDILRAEHQCNSPRAQLQSTAPAHRSCPFWEKVPPPNSNPHPKTRTRPGSPNSKKLDLLRAEHQCNSPRGSTPKYCSCPSLLPILGKSKPPTPTHTQKPGRGQVHPTARSLTFCGPNIHTTRLSISGFYSPRNHLPTMKGGTACQGLGKQGAFAGNEITTSENLRRGESDGEDHNSKSLQEKYSPQTPGESQVHPTARRPPSRHLNVNTDQTRARLVSTVLHCFGKIRSLNSIQDISRKPSVRTRRLYRWR